MKEIVVGSEIGRGEGSPPPATASAPPPALLERMKDYGQEDAFAYWDELSPEERNLLVKDIQVISSTFPSLEIQLDLFAFRAREKWGLS